MSDCYDDAREFIHRQEWAVYRVDGARFFGDTAFGPMWKDFPRDIFTTGLKIDSLEEVIAFTVPVECEMCAGEKQITGVFPVWVDTVSAEDRESSVEIDCPRCEATGWMPREMRVWIDDGAYFRKWREDVAGRGLREFADMVGVVPSELSTLENGMIDNRDLLSTLMKKYQENEE